MADDEKVFKWKIPGAEDIAEWKERRCDAVAIYATTGKSNIDRYMNTADVIFNQLQEANTTKAEIIGYYAAAKMGGMTRSPSLAAFERYMAYLLMMEAMEAGKQRNLEL